MVAEFTAIIPAVNRLPDSFALLNKMFVFYQNFRCAFFVGRYPLKIRAFLSSTSDDV
jgi:hypothetical protein